ncbi:MAG: hypothetical protein JSV63_01890 [Candidatus Aenigmatarchaeota archaeon]|nr:MAG: hypothetical protein JSV63_01890 [Candidatus Aenigmarchaeota archaeon]
MAKKALSPIVAVVVLVGVAILLGGLVSSWLGGFITESSKHDICTITTLYTISDAKVNETSGELVVRLKNSGKADLYNFSFEAENGTIIEVLKATSPDDTYKLGPGRTQLIRTNISNYNISRENITNIDTVKVLTASCPEYSPDPIKVENI